VDAEKGSRGPAFDHAKLAAALSKATGREYAADRLPFDDVTITDDVKVVRFKVGAAAWTCDLSTYAVENTGAPLSRDPESAEGSAAPTALPSPDEEPLEAPDPAAAAPQPPAKKGRTGGPSPDGKWTATIRANNVYLRDADGQETQLTTDGKDGLAYERLSWSPDSKALVAFRTEPGDRKEVHLIESSPKGGGRAVHTSRPYALPGDKFAAHEPHLFDVAAGKEIKVDVERIDFGFPVVRWAKDGRTFTYQKADRGHQRFR